MVECMVFGKRAKNSRCIHALHVNKTFNTYRARQGSTPEIFV